MKSTEERFWEKVQKTNECWNWKASLDTKGYGQFKYRGSMVHAQRVSWMIRYGTSLENTHCVRNHCGRRDCVNPEHLFLSTVAEKNRESFLNGSNLGPVSSLNEDHHMAVMLEHDGYRMTMKDWAVRTGILMDTISARLARGWTVSRALSEPPRRHPMNRKPDANGR